MLTKTKLVLAAVLLAGTANAALAEYDPNPANRYPVYAGPLADAPTYAAPGWVNPLRVAHRALQSAPVRLQDRSVYSGPVNPPPVNENDWYDTDIHDKASSPYAGGGGM